MLCSSSTRANSPSFGMANKPATCAKGAIQSRHGWMASLDSPETGMTGSIYDGQPEPHTAGLELYKTSTWERERRKKKNLPETFSTVSCWTKLESTEAASTLYWKSRECMWRTQRSRSWDKKQKHCKSWTRPQLKQQTECPQRCIAFNWQLNKFKQLGVC